MSEQPRRGPGHDEESRPRGAGGRTALQQTPNAEKYVLEADAMRRRQLRSALLHGSRRTWRDNPRSWPAVVIGLIVAAVIVAGLTVTQALKTTENNDKKQQQQQAPSSAPRTPPTSRPSVLPSGPPSGLPSDAATQPPSAPGSAGPSARAPSPSTPAGSS